MSFIRRAVRPARLAAVLSLAAGTVALAVPVASAAPAAPAKAKTGWIRLAHFSPDTPAVDVYLYSFGNPNAKIVLQHVTYGTVSPYEAVPSGEYTVAMRGAGAKPSSKPVLSTTVNIATGQTYTVAGMGPFSGIRLQILHDSLVTPKGKAKIRVIQASLQEHTVKFTADGKTVAEHLKFGDYTSYMVVKPGAGQVKAVGSTLTAVDNVDVKAETVHTFVVLDNPGVLAIDNLVDAAGSHEVPTGNPNTGLGGTAAVAGSSMTPWLAVVAAGLLVTAAGAVRFRRSRRTALHMR
jgi:hypothetical protein